MLLGSHVSQIKHSSARHDFLKRRPKCSVLKINMSDQSYITLSVCFPVRE